MRIKNKIYTERHEFNDYLSGTMPIGKKQLVQKYIRINMCPTNIMINTNFALEEPCMVVSSPNKLFKYKQSNSSLSSEGGSPPGMRRVSLLSICVLSSAYTTRHVFKSRPNY